MNRIKEVHEEKGRHREEGGRLKAQERGHRKMPGKSARRKMQEEEHRK